MNLELLQLHRINPGVTVVYPNGGEHLNSGNTITIEWQSAYINRVKIQYTKSSHYTVVPFRDIATVNAANGSYNWDIPEGIVSDNCKIKIYDNSNSSRMDMSDNNFSISE